MRHLLILGTYLMLLTSLAAQVSLSLDMGYGNKGYRYSEQGLGAYDGSLPEGQSCHIVAKAGCLVSDNVALGIQLGIGYSSYNYAQGYYNPTTAAWQRSATLNSRMLTATGGGYMRIRCFTVGHWILHAEIVGAYRMGWGRDISNEVRALNGTEMRITRLSTERALCAQVVPVASYAISHHVGVDFYLNLAALTFTSTTTQLWPYGTGTSSADGTPPERETTAQHFDVGINTLNTSLLTIGFSYTF